jgi:hypothetical protein
LHIAAFITLCEAYMGIEPHLNLWNYFRIQFWQDSGTEAAVWGCVDVYVWTGGEVDQYFHLSVSNPPARWRRQWFFLKNDIDVPLPTITGRRPTAQPYWGYGVGKKGIHKLRHVLDILKSLPRVGLLGADILRTFISRRVQPLRWQEMTMWRYPRPGCLDRSFSAELVDTEVDAWVWKLLALGARRPSAPGLAFLREGVGSPWVSPFELATM